MLNAQKLCVKHGLDPGLNYTDEDLYVTARDKAEMEARGAQSSTFFMMKRIDTRTFNRLIDKTNLKYPIVIQDTDDDPAALKNWRVIPTCDSGIIEMWASASAAPRRCDFAWIRKEVNRLTQSRAKRIVIVDLRQESHGYLNGHSINLTAQNNWINKDKAHAEALESESKWLQSLSQHDHAMILSQYDLTDTRSDQSRDLVKIEQIETEEQVVTSENMEYFRLTVADHQAPSAVEVDKFLNLVDQAQIDSWLHFHCRGGAGRSSTFLLMYHLLKLAKLPDFNQLVDLHANIHPFYNLATGSLYNLHLKECYEHRYQFIKNFYDYVNARHNGYTSSWSEWLSGGNVTVDQTKNHLRMSP